MIRNKGFKKGNIPWNRGLKGKDYLKHYKDGHTWNKGLTSENDHRILSGENNGMYGKHRYGENNPFYGHHHTLITKNNIGLSNKGKKAWNKGLKKKTNESVNKISITRKKRFKNGKLKCWKKGLTKEVDVRVLISAKKLKDNWHSKNSRMHGHKGEDHPMFGKHHTKEAIEKNRISNKKIWSDSNYKKKMLCKIGHSSKKEREIRKYFQINFPDDEWKNNQVIKYRDLYIKPDLMSNKLKIIFEYDGNFHFLNIFGQLEKRQYRDKLLEQYCLKKGIRIIRIDDNLYNKDSNYWLQEIIDKIYNETQRVIKLGNRY